MEGNTPFLYTSSELPALVGGGGLGGEGEDNVTVQSVFLEYGNSKQGSLGLGGELAPVSWPV